MRLQWNGSFVALLMCLLLNPLASAASIDASIDFYSEFMNVRHFSDVQHLRSMQNFYRRKYIGRQIDLIIAAGLRPLEFLLTDQEELFPTTPVVFCSIDPHSLENFRLGPHITGIVRQLDFKGTLELALTLQTGTKCVVVIGGTSSTDQYHRTLAVGGHMRSYEAAGIRVAGLGGRILNGERPADLPIINTGSNAYLFDWQQLRRWGISEDKLPPGSLVPRRELSLWQQYKGSIIAGGLLCTAEALLIVALLRQCKRRRKVEQRLAERLRFEMLSSDLSSIFNNLSPNGDREKYMLEGLQRLAEFFGADRSSFSEFVEPVGAFRVLHSWAVEGFEPVPSETTVGQYPWCVEQLLQGNSIRFTRLEEFSDAAVADRESFRTVGIKSLILVPLTAGDTVLGSLACVMLRTERAWTDEQAQRLRLLGEIFANALLRQRAEQALLASEALNSAVLASLHSLVAVIDNEGVIIAVNESWSRLARDHVKSEAHVAVGANYLNVCRRAAQRGDHDAYKALIGIEAVLQGSRTEFLLEYRCVQSAEAQWYVMSVEPLKRPENGAVISHSDITQRKRAEIEAQRHRDELAHVARVTMMGELAASIAHEITHPLFAMTTNADACRRWLADGIVPTQEMLHALEDIVKDGNRASAVMQRIRALLNKEALQFTLLDINESIHEIIALVRSELLSKQVTVHLDLADDLPPVYGDRVQLQQVILNFIRNAEDAMTEVAAEDRTVVVRTIRSEMDTVQVAVQDCGNGLREVATKKMFEPFYTTKPEGMGMGLTICRSIIDAHGGQLWAVNNPEDGATFYFSLPVREELS